MDAWRRLWCEWPWTQTQWSRCRALAEEGGPPPSVDRIRDVLGTAWPGARSWATLERRALQQWEARPFGPAELHADDGTDLWSSSSYGYVTGSGDVPVGTCRVGIVGTRRLDTAACRWWKAWLQELLASVDDVVIVSGGAFGVDWVVQEAALAVGRPMEVRLAGGLFHTGPRAHRRSFLDVVAAGGRLCWNAPPALPAHRGAFLRRNTWLAASVDLLVVVRAPVRSGAMHTAGEARRLGVPVLAVPGDLTDPLAEGPLALLAHGAGLVRGPDDLQDAVEAARGGGVRSARPPATRARVRKPMNVSRPRRDAPALPRDAAGVVALLAEDALDESALLRRSGLDATRVAELLLQLELDGHLRRDPGGRWSVVSHDGAR